MRQGEASRTAAHMALFRALENASPRATRRIADPFARAFVDARLRAVVTLCALPGGRDLVCCYIDRRWPGARTSAVARTSFIDDRADAAVAAGRLERTRTGVEVHEPNPSLPDVMPQRDEATPRAEVVAADGVGGGLQTRPQLPQLVGGLQPQLPHVRVLEDERFGPFDRARDVGDRVVDLADHLPLLHDRSSHRGKPSGRDTRAPWAADAQRWIDADDWTWPASFRSVCDVLSLDAAGVREALRTASERLPKRRTFLEKDRCPSYLQAPTGERHP
jgi:hypothetical protein